MARIAVLVLVLAVGFGAGWITYDATHKTRTVVVQHKKAPCVKDILDPTTCVR
jgi:hypothetical protein